MSLFNKLVLAVEDMRAKQKAYFKDRSRERLIESKEAEKRVDQILMEIADVAETPHQR